MAKTSFNPETFTSGLSEGRVTISKAIFEERESDWGNQIVMVIEMTDADGKVHPRFYNVGKTEFCQVGDDGRSVESVDADSEYRISGKSGAGKFFAALCSAGMDPAVLDSGDISALEGIEMDVETVSSGTKKLDGSAGSILLPSKVVGGVPVVKGKGKVAAKPVAKSAAKPVAKPVAKKAVQEEAEEEEETEEAEEESIEQVAFTFINSILGDQEDGTLTTKQIGTEIFNRMKKDPRKAEVMKLANSATFLSENFNYDPKTKTISAVS